MYEIPITNLKMQNTDIETEDKQQVYTTNAEDQAAVKALKDRIAADSASRSSSRTTPKDSNNKEWKPVPSVIIANGAHKYVLITAQEPVHGTEEGGAAAAAAEEESASSYFVTSKYGAHYHRNAAEPLIDRLEMSGYTNIQVLGGGRIFLDDDNKKISIFGYSYGFGRADHLISQKIIQADERYKDYDVTWSNDGY